MERLRKRAFMLSAFLIIVGGIALTKSGQAAESQLTERVMEEKAPLEVPGYDVIPGPQGLAYTYRMDDTTYAVLRPFGIVARQYTDGHHTYDAVLITSNSHESFHDPKICFSGQGWTFKSTSRESIEIPDGRIIPATVVEMSGPLSDTATAIYFYKGPKGFVADPKRLQLDMFNEVLFGRNPADSTFYRFMPASQGTSREQLKEFIKTYMVSAAEQSGGLF
jgi:hypothetical protein